MRTILQMSSGEKWVHRRKTITSAIYKQKMMNMLSMMVKMLKEKIEEFKAKDGEAINIHREII